MRLTAVKTTLSSVLHKCERSKKPLRSLSLNKEKEVESVISVTYLKIVVTKTVTHPNRIIGPAK